MNYNVGAYIRLSKDDGTKSESYSVSNQRDLINNFIKNNADLNLIDYYIDDGWSGTSFDRPNFNRMIEDIKSNKINTIVVKDLSRFGRNYLEAGNYLEKILPLYKARFISINDNIDNVKNYDTFNSILLPFKNLLNDEYSRDISTKIKSILRFKQKKGEYVAGTVPYGYLRSKDDKHKLVIDEEAAKVVKMIFNLANKGRNGIFIADYLNKLEILTPIQYKNKILKNKTLTEEIESLKWTGSTVNAILKNQVYCGDTIQYKYKKINYKNDKCIMNEKKDWIIVKSTHDPIIDITIYNKIQEILFTKIQQARKGEYLLFSGFLRCDDCHRGLNRNGNIYHGKNKTTNNYFYSCGTYVKISKEKCTPHKIKETDLIKQVIKDINKQIRYLKRIELKINEVNLDGSSSLEKQIIQKDINLLKIKIKEKQNIKRDLYTDYKDSLISYDDYMNYFNQYENEIESLQKKVQRKETKLKKMDSSAVDNSSWIKLFTNYDSITNLDRNILFDLVDLIFVKEDGSIYIKYKFQNEIDKVSEYFKK